MPKPHHTSRENQETVTQRLDREIKEAKERATSVAGTEADLHVIDIKQSHLRRIKNCQYFYPSERKIW